MAEAADALEAVQRLVDRLTDDNAGVFHGVVEVDVQVALGADLQVDAAVACEGVQHMIEEADAGLDIGHARAVQIHADRDLGLFSVAADFRRSRHFQTSFGP